MDLTFTPEQEMLRETVRQMMGKYSSPEIVRELEDDPKGYRDDLLAEMARADLFGLTLPEEAGGAGQTMLEMAVVYEEMGRALCLSPHFTTAVLGSGLVGGALHGPIARGEAIVTVALFEPGRGEEPSSFQARAERDGDGWRITGTKHLVPFAVNAGHVVVLARTGPDALGLFLTDPGSAAMERQLTMGSDASWMLTFDGAPASLLAADGWAVLEDAMADAWIALGAWATGGARRALELAVGYAKERVQFDRPIGSFQGLAHPLAEIAMEVEGAAVLVWRAAAARAAGEGGPLPAMAKLYACDVFRRATKVAQQVFGGIGFTTDIDIQLYFRRAKQLELSWFGPKALEERIAAAELDAPTPFVRSDAGIDP